MPVATTPTIALDGAVGHLVDVQVDVSPGQAGLTLVGSTGQWPLFTVPERKAIAECVVQAAAGRLPVMVHVGAVTTADAIELAGHAARVGADAVSAVGPIYFQHPADFADGNAHPRHPGVRPVGRLLQRAARSGWPADAAVPPGARPRCAPAPAPP